MIKLKNYDVDMSMIDPRMWERVRDIAGVFNQYGLDTIITSGREGRHGAHSHHYRGRALDFRTFHIPLESTKLKLTSEVQAALGDDFDVVLEETHLHVEYDPK